MSRDSGRILTTHCGSLARPGDLLDLMRAKAAGGPFDENAYAERISTAVADCVRAQSGCGIDIVSDGEQGKHSFFGYVAERLNGFEGRPDARGPAGFDAEVTEFPEYYEQYFAVAMLGGSVLPPVPLACVGPVSYRGHDAIQRDLGNLTAAVADTGVRDAFVPSVAPSGVGRVNEYYATDEEYFFAVAEAMRTEYQAIADAGFMLQIDDPHLTEMYSYLPLSDGEKRKRGEMYVEAVNHGLRGIPEDRIRYHTCYGINEGPRVRDCSLADVIDLVLRVNAGTYSFEAANPRHEHEYHLWETVKLPEGKVLLPGVITHASNIVEHPEMIAERLVRYAERAGRDNVVAGSDCGFSSQATYKPEVHPTVVWAKFQAMAEGARLASARLWRG
jgi:5-methyltetrahydropteroyltriglutamate--homocysteine methyltransferase